MSATIRKTRRPIGMRTDVAAYDPREDPHSDGGTMGMVAFFEYLEDAVAAGKEWVEPQGWIVRPQYVGRYDLWMLMAERKSWGYSRSAIIVQACLDAHATAQRHAHVPHRYSYGLLPWVRTADADLHFRSKGMQPPPSWIEHER